MMTFCTVYSGLIVGVFGIVLVLDFVGDFRRKD